MGWVMQEKHPAKQIRARSVLGSLRHPVLNKLWDLDNMQLHKPR